MLKKILLAFIASVILFTSTASPILAASTGTWYNQTFPEWFQKVNDSPPDEIFGERYTAAQVQWVIYGFFNFLLNVATNGNNQVLVCLMTKNLESCKSALQNLKLTEQSVESTMAQTDVGNVISSLGQSPVSFSAYVRDVKENFVLVPKAEAQQAGFGFNQLNPALNMWKVFRNLSYGLMVFVIIAFAFMIMFRVKISPQAVITVQSSLPKIAITLILVTFSYAIAGLMIDLMYVVMGLLSGIFAANFSTQSWATIFETLAVKRGIFEMLMSYWWMFLASSILSIFSSALPAGLLLMILSFISILVLLWYSIKVIILLIKTYIQIMLLVIFSPIIILAGALSPQAGFGSWFKSMLSNLAVYPVVATLFVIAIVFARTALPEWWPAFLTPLDVKDFTTGGQTWTPPMTTFGTGSGGTNLLWILVSYGIIVMIPKVTEIIQGFMSGKGFDYGTAIGETAGYIKGAVNSAPAARAEQHLYQKYIGKKLSTGPEKIADLNKGITSWLKSRYKE